VSAQRSTGFNVIRDYLQWCVQQDSTGVIIQMKDARKIIQQTCRKKARRGARGGNAFDDPTVAGLDNFPRFQGTLRALCFTDDPWATRPAVELLCSGFKSISPEIMTIARAQAAGRKIGHFGFFRPEHRYTLWREAADWIAAVDNRVLDQV
jgi:hypothetical protein